MSMQAALLVRMRCRLSATTAVAILWMLVAVGPATAFSPESPEVKAAVARGLKFLATAEDQRLGAKALAGRVLAADGQRDHVKVKEAVAAIRQELATPTNLDIYSHGLSIVFLAELDPFQYRAELDGLIARLVAVQKPHGGWGYSYLGTGDTSMTQYAVLAMWTASEAGIATPLDSWERVTNWLIRTQDPSGAFGYQAVLPSNDDLIQQTGINPTLAAAGLASLYLCADHLGFLHLGMANDLSLPAALKPAKEPKGELAAQAKLAAKTKAVDWERLSKAIARAVEWCATHGQDRPQQYLYYYWYTIERMQTFREASQTMPSAAGAWYDDGVRQLFQAQREDGSWTSTEDVAPATSFAILFLIRSTRKTLARERSFGSGTLVGGRGLPPTDAEVELRLGKIVARPLAGPAEELLTKMEDPTHPDFLRAVEGLEQLATQADAPLLSKHAEQLRRLAEGKSPSARAAALRALARTRNLDHAPVLIEALKDSDLEVYDAALEGLRFMARRFAPAAPGGEPTPAERRLERSTWQDWYRSVRPDAVFED